VELTGSPRPLAGLVVLLLRGGEAGMRGMERREEKVREGKRRGGKQRGREGEGGP